MNPTMKIRKIITLLPRKDTPVLLTDWKNCMKLWRQRFVREESGAIMVEFGLMLPLLILLLVGGVEVSRFILFHQKVDNATSRVADLITQMDLDKVPCTGNGGLEWMRNDLMVETMKPYDFNANGQMVVSAVEASHPDPTRPNNNQPMRQIVKWQWNSGGTNLSRIGAESARATGTGWPTVFRGAPSGTPGGLNDGDRVIVVEVFYNYDLLLPGMDVLVPEEGFREIYKTAFYRARFSNMSELGDDCN